MKKLYYALMFLASMVFNVEAQFNPLQHNVFTTNANPVVVPLNIAATISTNGTGLPDTNQNSLTMFAGTNSVYGTPVLTKADAYWYNNNASASLFVGGGGNYLIASGNSDVSIGLNSLGQLTTGSYNVSVGPLSLFQITSGIGNTSIGYGSGVNITGNTNIDIAARGVVGETQITRIGENQTNAYIAGFGTNSGTGAIVFTAPVSPISTITDTNIGSTTLYIKTNLSVVSNTTMSNIIAQMGGTNYLSQRATTAPDGSMTNSVLGMGYTTVAASNNLWVAGSINPVSGIIGTVTAGFATAGNVGEVITNVVAPASQVALTTTVVANEGSVSLTAGTWLVQFHPSFVAASTTAMTAIVCGINTSTAALPSTAQCGFWGGGTITGAATNTIACPPLYVSVNTTTTVFGVAKATFTVSTAAVFGEITAQRLR